MWSFEDTRVFRVDRVALGVIEGDWPFARERSCEIERYWEQRTRENPKFFNGKVHLLVHYAVSDARVLTGHFIRTDFKSFLLWREQGWGDPGVMDAFGSALILSAEGHVLLGRQSRGNLNGDLSYPPGGFIDARDVGADGAIDLDGSVMREIVEETGLGSDVLTRAGGYVITIAGPVLSIAVPWRSSVSSAELIGRVTRHIEADPDSELMSVVLVPAGAAVPELSLPPYARALLDGLSSLKSHI